MLLAEDLLVIAEPGHFVFQVLDLTLRQGPLLHILVSHALDLLVALTDKEFCLVELLLNS